MVVNALGTIRLKNKIKTKTVICRRVTPRRRRRQSATDWLLVITTFSLIHSFSCTVDQPQHLRGCTASWYGKLCWHLTSFSVVVLCGESWREDATGETLSTWGCKNPTLAQNRFTPTLLQLLLLLQSSWRWQIKLSFSFPRSRIQTQSNQNS